MAQYCPRDNHEMVVREAEGHIGYVCSECKGIWLSQTFLKSIKYTYHYSAENFLEELKAGQAQHSTLKCPRGCGSMVCTKANDMSIDRCDSCMGVWFDRDELQSWLAKLTKQPDPSGMVKGAAADIGLSMLLSIFIS